MEHHELDQFHLFDCFINLLRQEYGFLAQLQFDIELQNLLQPNKKSIIVKTPFKGFSIQIITNLQNSIKIIYCDENNKNCYDFNLGHIYPYEQIITDEKIIEYFGKSLNQPDRSSIINIVNIIIRNIRQGFTIDHFSKLLQYCRCRLGISDTKGLECVYEHISSAEYAHLLDTYAPKLLGAKAEKLHHCSLYKQGFLALQGAIVNETSTALIKNKSLITSLQNIVLSFLIYNN